MSTTCAQRQENRVIRRRLMLDRLGHGVSAVTLEMEALHPWPYSERVTGKREVIPR